MDDKKLKSPFLWTFFILLFFSIGVLIPVIPAIEFSFRDRDVTINIPQFPKTIYLWGRPINLRPDHLLDLEYRPGFFHIFELGVSNQEIENETLLKEEQEMLSNAIEKRVNTFYSWPAKIHYIQEDKQYLVLETLHLADRDVITALVTFPGNLSFFIQDGEIDEEDLIFSDSWEDGFKFIDINNNNIVKATAQIDFQTNLPMVALTLNDQGRSTLFRVTRENSDKLLMVTIDGSTVLLSPIREPIHTGKISIFGGRSLEQAKIISSAISSPLPRVATIPDESVNLDLTQLSKEQSSRFLGLFDLTVIQIKITIIVIILTVLSLISIVVFKKSGLLLSLMLWSVVIIGAAFSRIMQMVVDSSLLIALSLTAIYWWMSATGLLFYATRIQKKEQMSKTESLLTSLSFKNKIIRRSGAILLLSSLILVSLSSSNYLGMRFSSSFSQALFNFSLLSVGLTALFIMIIRDLFLSEEAI